MSADLARFLWIRHAPSSVKGIYTGHHEVSTTLPEKPLSKKHSEKFTGYEHWFSSPLSRCADTASWLAENCKKKDSDIKIDAALKEQHFGEWEGKTYDEIYTKHQSLIDDTSPESLLPPGGESFEQMVKRIAKWTGETLEKHQSVLVVAHAGTIRAGIAHALAISAAQALACSPAPLSMTEIRYYRTKDGWKGELLRFAEPLG